MTMTESKILICGQSQRSVTRCWNHRTLSVSYHRLFGLCAAMQNCGNTVYGL